MTANPNVSPRLVSLVERAKTSKAPKRTMLPAYPTYINRFRHNGQSGKPIGYSLEEYSGQYAKASAAEDATSWSRNDGAMRYEHTLRLDPDGTYTIVDLSE